MSQFGVMPSDGVCVVRPCAYAIIIDACGNLLCVRYKESYFLPGGGVEPGESFEQALHREVMEEVGCAIQIGAKIGIAAEYIYAKDESKWFNNIGHFFHANRLGESHPQIDMDHEPKWLAIEEFESSAAPKSHIWAVNRSTR